MTVPLIDINNIQLDGKYCITDEQRDEQVKYAVKEIKGRIEPHADRDNEEVAVVCYGPSLRDTLEDIKKYKYIITCSGAHKYLIDRDIIPTWHVDVDPREHKVELLGKPHKDVEYLVQSAIHPKYVDLIKNYNVKLWHGYHNEIITNLPPMIKRGEWIFGGGCTAGLRTLLIARFLGFKKISVFGMDCSFPHDNDGEHADFHPNPSKKDSIFKTEYCGYIYYTTGGMLLGAKQFFREVAYLKDCQVAVHGVGLLQHMGVTKYQDPNNINTGPGIFAFCVPLIGSTDYINQNKQLHALNQYYGISGSKYKDEVLRLSEKYETKDILDYGCGKGTLAKSLPFTIKEYDPAIEGKDNIPVASDIVICTDVLEHIEPEYVDNVLADLNRCIIKIGYFVINTGPAQKTLPDGRNTHVLQKNKVWWSEKLEKFFTVENIQEQGSNLHVWVRLKNNTKVKTIEDIDNENLEFMYAEVEGIKYIKINSITASRAETVKTKEPCTIEWLDSFNKDDIFVDIGANVGIYTLWAAKKNGIKTYAFEPESQNYALLIQNIYLNKISSNVKAYNIAIGNKVGTGELYLTNFMPGSSCHQLDSILDYDGNPLEYVFKQSCLTFTLDYMVQNNFIEQPTHIKIDVDGLESNVILGAMSTLQNVKSLLIEVNKRLEHHQQMIRILNALGFYYDDNQVNKALRKSGPFQGIGEYVFKRS